MGHEVTVIEQRQDRFDKLEAEFEHQVQHGDATEIYTLERGGIARPPDSFLQSPATTRTTSSSARSRRRSTASPKVIARVNDPRNQAHFDLLGISPTVSATSTILALVEHEVPEHGLIHLLELRNENLEIVEVQIEKGSPSAGKTVADLAVPQESRLISVTREGTVGDRGRLDQAPSGRSRPRDPQARPGRGIPQGSYFA